MSAQTNDDNNLVDLSTCWPNVPLLSNFKPEPNEPKAITHCTRKRFQYEGKEERRSLVITKK